MTSSRVANSTSQDEQNSELPVESGFRCKVHDTFEFFSAVRDLDTEADWKVFGPSNTQLNTFYDMTRDQVDQRLMNLAWGDDRLCTMKSVAGETYDPDLLTIMSDALSDASKRISEATTQRLSKRDGGFGL